MMSQTSSEIHAVYGIEPDRLNAMMSTALRLSFANRPHREIVDHLVAQSCPPAVAEQLALSAASQRAAAVRREALHSLGDSILWLTIGVAVSVFSFFALEGRGFYYGPGLLLLCFYFVAGSLYSLATGRHWKPPPSEPESNQERFAAAHQAIRRQKGAWGALLFVAFFVLLILAVKIINALTGAP